MKFLVLACLFLLPLGAFADDDPTELQVLGLTGENTGPDCSTRCETTRLACKQRCRDATARGDVRHFDEADVSVPKCIGDCETEASICQEDC
ncbi:MAG: hypothetical protein N838_05170 [Thiohalocapsa sp. PB-PSB1]|jgi:hypothetical protein|nr:MAG: hypothetical protein N838_04095 [Thiohalocapsa sp. PB-PSB1]QQO52852.1 MAG: hypothetical protein N838_05170 [Thiohalocapsa sp. PB-PSB1]HCS90968.1 hypothetical protein [Chromatiaceae bacterium]